MKGARAVPYTLECKSSPGICPSFKARVRVALSCKDSVQDIAYSRTCSIDVASVPKLSFEQTSLLDISGGRTSVDQEDAAVPSAHEEEDVALEALEVMERGNEEDDVDEWSDDESAGYYFTLVPGMMMPGRPLSCLFFRPPPISPSIPPLLVPGRESASFRLP